MEKLRSDADRIAALEADMESVKAACAEAIELAVDVARIGYTDDVDERIAMLRDIRTRVRSVILSLYPDLRETHE